MRNVCGKPPLSSQYVMGRTGMWDGGGDNMKGVE